MGSSGLIAVTLTDKRTYFYRGSTSWGWSDKSATEYERWGLGFPNTAVENNCVRMRYDVGDTTGSWENVDCQQVGLRNTPVSCITKAGKITILTLIRIIGAGVSLFRY